MPNPTKTDKADSVVLSVDTNEMEKQRLARDVQRAEARSKQQVGELEARKKSPKGVHVAHTVNQYREHLERRYVPEAFTTVPEEELAISGVRDGKPYRKIKAKYQGVYRPGATKACYWDEKAKHNRTIERGYIPVLDDTGQHVNDGNGDYLYWRPIELLREELGAATQMSEERMRQNDRAMAAASAESKAGGESTVNLLEDVTEVTQRSTP